jgi:hypothetical protein
MSNLILYTTEDGKSQVQLRADLDTVQRRKAEEAHAADAQDEAELKALENTINNRPKP